MAIELKVIHVKSLLKQLMKVAADKRADSMPASLNPDKTLEDLLAQLNLSERQVASEKIELGDQHTKILLMERILKQTRGQIDRRVEGIARGLEGEVEHQQEQLQFIKQRIQEEAAMGTHAASKLHPYYEAKRAVEIAQRIYDSLQLRIAQETVDAKVTERESKVEIFDRAEPPLRGTWRSFSLLPMNRPLERGQLCPREFPSNKLANMAVRAPVWRWFMVPTRVQTLRFFIAIKRSLGARVSWRQTRQGSQGWAARMPMLPGLWTQCMRQPNGAPHELR